MQDVIYKICDNFTVSWDPEKISVKFPVIKNKDRSVYIDPKGNAHWQFFESNIMFGRNFYYNYRLECIEVVEKLKVIQEKLRKEQSPNYLTKIFLNHKIEPSRVNLLKTIPGKDIKLHKDITRGLCINIGLKNSNKWETIISKDNDINNFNSSQKNTFLINDGDAYIVLINNPHTAKCLNTSDLESTRFLITYTVTNQI